MKKYISKISLLSLFAVVFFSFFAFTAFAESGYAKNKEGRETNIKWTLTDDGVITFEIDPTATDKVQTTVVYDRDPKEGTSRTGQNSHPTYDGITKIIFGEGITEVAGFAYVKGLTTVEIPKSLVTIGFAAFEGSRVFDTLYVRGTEPVKGTFDLSYVTKFEDYCFDYTSAIEKIILNPALTGNIPQQFIKDSKVEEIEIPAGVSNLKSKSFDGVLFLKTVAILGKDTVIASDAFTGSETFPAIKAYSGSKAEEFAKANGFTFIDIETGMITGGALPGPGEEKEDTPPKKEFDPTGATVWGHSSRDYQGTQIVNTYWAYYDDTKTLEFTSATTAYNETGTVADCDDGNDWMFYKNEIEHIIVGPDITKISGSAFKEYPSLKDVCFLGMPNQIDGDAFSGCSNLTTIWMADSERIEGRADFSRLQNMTESITGTAIREIVLPTTVTEIKTVMPTTAETLYAYTITEHMIEYAKESFLNLVNINNPSEKYEYYFPIDGTLPRCGKRATYDFDEATGTLIIGGVGVVDDIVNYYGGGSKNQPWFDIKQQIKHVVIGENITVLGKYTFCQCANLETVQLPNREDFSILNGAFEKCPKLNAVYIAGKEPIEGTADLSTLSEVISFTFSGDYLIANAIFGANLTNLKDTAFDENPNFANIYGVPGTAAEEFAKKMELTFIDASTATPEPITCPIPETSTAETESTASTEQTESTASPEETEGEQTGASDITEETPLSGEYVFNFIEVGSAEDGKSGAWVIIVISATAVLVLALAAVFLGKKHKKKD